MNTNDLPQVLQLIKAAQAKALAADQLAKAGWSQPGSAISGINQYDLEQGAKLLFPVTSILRNMIPRVTGGVGIQANWRTVLAANPSNEDIGVSEGNRGAAIDQTTADVLAKFAGLGNETFVTYEAQMAANTFEDLKALAVKVELEALMESEEKVIIGGNATNPLGTTPTPTGTPSTTGGTLAASTTNSIIAVALTYNGWQRSSVANGVRLSYTRTNTDGSTDTINGFAGQKSAASAAITTTGSTSSIACAVAAVKGAVAYAWFAGATAGTERLFAVTTTNAVTLTALNGSGQLASALPSSDGSTNGLVFDGLFTQICKSGSGAYFKDNGGAFLTSSGSGSGGIAEIDVALQSFYDNFRLVPTDIFMSGQDQRNAKNKILNGNTNLAPFFMANGGEQNLLAAGAQFKQYVNPIGYGNQMLNVHVHPFFPPGTIMFYSRNVPYSLSNVGTILRVLCRRDYYQIEWPLRSRKYEFGLYMDEVLQNYYLPAFGLLTNVGNG